MHRVAAGCRQCLQQASRLLGTWGEHLAPPRWSLPELKAEERATLRVFAGLAWGLAVLPACGVYLRGVAGELLHTLPAIGVIALGFLLTAMGLAAQCAWCCSEERAATRGQYLWRRTWQAWLTTFPLAVAWDTSLPAESPFAAAVLLLLWSLSLAASVCGPWWVSLPLQEKPTTENTGPDYAPLSSMTSRTITPSQKPDTIAEPDLELEEAEPEEAGDAAASHWQRRTATGGEEVLTGMSVARFQPGEKQIQLHLSFCPPLARPPQLDFALPEGLPVRCKAAAVYAYGARLELRRTEAAEELDFPVHYTAQARLPGTAADSAA